MTFTRRQADSRMAWSTRVQTSAPDNMRFLLKYGPQVLSPRELRRQLRRQLGEYVWFQAKQRIKPSRWRDADFHRFHREVIALLDSESNRDREVLATTTIVRTLLNRPD